MSTTSFFKSLLNTSEATKVAPDTDATPKRPEYLPHTRKYLAAALAIVFVTGFLWLNPPQPRLDARAALVLEIDDLSRQYETLAAQTLALQDQVETNQLELADIAQAAATLRADLLFQ